MYDPMTVAFEIRYPWRAYRGKKLSGIKGASEFERTYRRTFITIWHVDPERRGSDDSCGWFSPPFNKVQREIVTILAQDEAREPWFQSLPAKSNDNPVECESLIRGAYLLVSRCLENRLDWRPWRLRKRPVTLEEATKWASVDIHNSIDNYRTMLCFKSGWASNWYNEGTPNTVEQDKFWRQERAESFFGSIMARILRERRPWYRHPRWHLYHWKFQVEPLLHFKRWAFSRCQKCGGRFAWGYAPVSGQWSGTGPLWFRSEKDVAHSDCRNPTSECCAQSEVKAK